MIQLRKAGVVADSEDVQRLKREFGAKQCVLLPKLMDPTLLDFLLQRMALAQWRDKIHKGIGAEVILGDVLAITLLHFVTNAPVFLSAVEEITSCKPLTWFGGRVYRFAPNSGHFDSWHSDYGNGLAGMSVNLSPKGYSGGTFQLRERGAERTLVEVRNTGFGDALLFRLAARLDHQVTEVTGDEPKTAFAGWFKSGHPNFKEVLHDPKILLTAR